MKKAVVYVILLSIVLHCAERCGLISYLYEQRHDMAFSLGLIDEVPIAMCNSDYDFDHGLNIESADTGHSLPPVQFAREITFFLTDTKQVMNIQELACLGDVGSTTYQFPHYPDPGTIIFQPPKNG